MDCGLCGLRTHYKSDGALNVYPVCDNCLDRINTDAAYKQAYSRFKTTTINNRIWLLVPTRNRPNFGR